MPHQQLTFCANTKVLKTVIFTAFPPQIDYLNVVLRRIASSNECIYTKPVNYC
jgi:hypothetical protein